ncbi:MAG: hypothetical protein ACK475_11425, partial [Bacteroidota bacterium]
SGLQTPATSSNDVMLINGTTGQVQKITQANLFAGQGWSITGNSATTNGGTLGATPTGNFLGTTGTAGAARDLSFVTGNVIRAQISSAGVLSTQNDIVVNSVSVGRGAAGLVDNTAIGSGAMSVVSSTGGNNSAFGRFALAAVTSGGGNSAFGSLAGRLLTTGEFNT